jgi:hypothetical protein
MYRLPAAPQATALGAWQEIVGWQNSGQPTHLQHGAYGGHQDRGFHNNMAGYGGPAWAPRYGGPWGFGPGMALMGAEAGPMGPPPMPMGPPMPMPQAFFGPPTPAFWPTQQAWPYTIPPRNLLVDRPGPIYADRVILPLSSGVNILPNTSAQITARPQLCAFRPERCILQGPDNWVINDVKVGNQSQFAQSGDIPGEVFGSTTIDAFLKFTTVQTAMDFVVVATFVGASESGAPFVCAVLGTGAVN